MSQKVNSMSPASFDRALSDLRARSARGEVRLQGAPGGRPGEMMVLFGEHAFLVPPSGNRIRAIPRGELDRMAITHAVAMAGGVAVMVTWILALVTLLMGQPLVGALLAGGVASFLFVSAILIESVFAAKLIVVGPRHPLAEEATTAMVSATGPEPGVDALLRAQRARPRSLEQPSLELHST